MGKRLQIVTTLMLGAIAASTVISYWMFYDVRQKALAPVIAADDDCARNPEMGCSYYYDESVDVHCWIFRETEYASAEAFCMSGDEYDVFTERKVRRYIQIQREN